VEELNPEAARIVGAQLGGIPEALLQPDVVGFFFGGGGPEHNPFFPCCLARQRNLTGKKGNWKGGIWLGERDEISLPVSRPRMQKK
jgi:hypothetical protein